MILDAAIEAKLDTKLLEEWYCRDENSVPAAYYLRPKSEMLKSNKNAVSYLVNYWQSDYKIYMERQKIQNSKLSMKGEEQIQRTATIRL